MDIDTAIKFTAETFAQELQKLRERRKQPFQVPDKFTLTVEVSDKGGMSIEHSQGYSTGVRAADFGTLLDEIYRRAGFEDREAGRLQEASKSLLALPHETGEPK